MSADAVAKGYIYEFYEDKLVRGDAAQFSVTGTDVVEGVDFGLKRGATISGWVIDAVTGLPIAKIDVRATSANRDTIFGEETNINGRYTLKGIPDGVVEIVVGGQGYISTSKTVIIRDAQDLIDIDF